MSEGKYYAGVILVGIFISLPGWFLIFSSPILGASLIIFSIILQQLIIVAAKKHKLHRLQAQQPTRIEEQKQDKTIEYLEAGKRIRGETQEFN